LYIFLGSGLSGGSSINDKFLINSKLSILVVLVVSFSLEPLVVIGSLFFGLSSEGALLFDSTFLLFELLVCLFGIADFLISVLLSGLIS
jgi:hypothetical protein